MKAIIPVAGECRRTRAISQSPKCLLELGGKPVLHWLLRTVKEHLYPDAIVLVVGYRETEIREYVRAAFPKLPILFSTQTERLGDGHAVSMAREHVREHEPVFIAWGDILVADDFSFLREDTVWLAQVDDVTPFGLAQTIGNRLSHLVEKPKDRGSGLVFSGSSFFVDSKPLFDVLAEERHFTDALCALSAGRTIRYRRASRMIDCGTSAAYHQAVARWTQAELELLLGLEPEEGIWSGE